MNQISDLLQLNQVRGILTVSSADLPDEILADYGLEDDLEAILDKKLETWRELSELKHLRSLRLFVKYKAASLVALTAPVFVMKKMSDGANEGQRSDRDGFLWLSQSLSDRADSVMDELLGELGEDISVGMISLVGKSEPTRDPITEPREDVS